MSVDRYDQHVLGADDSSRPCTTVRRTRGNLVTFAVLSVLAPMLGLPPWTLIALLATTAAIPIAAELHGLPPLFGVRLLGRASIPRRSGFRRPG